MNKTEQSRQALLQALNTLPNDNALVEVKQNIRLAIQKLERVEEKRAKRAEAPPTQHQQWWQTVNGSVLNPYDAQRTMKTLDDMIDEQQKKLEEIKARKNKKNSEQQEEGDDLQLLG